MILLPEEKSSDTTTHSASSSFVADHAPAGSAGRIAASSNDSVRQQAYTVIPSSESPLQGFSYDPELPPPVYESINDIGNSTAQRAGVPNIDVKADHDAAPIRGVLVVSPSSQADAPPDTQTTYYEPSEEPSVYARPPNISEMIGAGASNAPPSYTQPSGPKNVYPRYSSPSSFTGPPLPTPSRDLLSFGSAKSQSQDQSPPMPPSFSRPLPPNLIFDTFPPMYLIANGKHLG